MSSRGPRSRLGREHVEALEWLPPQYQVKKHEGFAQAAVATRGDRDFSTDIEAGRTPQLARPPAWVPEDTTTHCQDAMARALKKDEMWGTRTAGDVFDTSSTREAEALCAGCPVREACLAAALEEEGSLSTGGRFLVRGGKTPAQRFRMYRDATAARGKAPFSANPSVTSEPHGRMQAAG